MKLSDFRNLDFQNAGGWPQSVKVVFCALLGFVQEFRAERALEALRRMLASTITVLRGGEAARVPAQAVASRVKRLFFDASVFAVGALQPLVPLLRLEAQGRDRPRIEPANPDRLVGFFAIAIGPALDPLQRLVNLDDELALAIARA